ncbi:hypothetical protein, partial [Rhizobium sp.]|uniref:hypothetical protein n=1 Tax=Rhizobium sp. TaxID=391 RepID=UPI0028B20B8F
GGTFAAPLVLCNASLLFAVQSDAMNPWITYVAEAAGRRFGSHQGDCRNLAQPLTAGKVSDVAEKRGRPQRMATPMGKCVRRSRRRLR